MKGLCVPAIVWAIILAIVFVFCAPPAGAFIFSGESGTYTLSCPIYTFANGKIDKKIVAETMTLDKGSWVLYKKDATGKNQYLLGGPFVHAANTGHWFFWPGDPNSTRIVAVFDAFGLGNVETVVGMCALRRADRQEVGVTPCSFSPKPVGCP